MHRLELNSYASKCIHSPFLFLITEFSQCDQHLQQCLTVERANVFPWSLLRVPSVPTGLKKTALCWHSSRTNCCKNPGREWDLQLEEVRKNFSRKKMHELSSRRRALSQSVRHSSAPVCSQKTYYTPSKPVTLTSQPNASYFTDLSKFPCEKW